MKEGIKKEMRKRQEYNVTQEDVIGAEVVMIEEGTNP
jgi:hypothetical protein